MGGRCPFRGPDAPLALVSGYGPPVIVSILIFRRWKSGSGESQEVTQLAQNRRVIALRVLLGSALVVLLANEVAQQTPTKIRPVSVRFAGLRRAKGFFTEI